MRDYAQLKPRFWVQGTGKALRKDRDARMLAIYLCSAPTSNLIGLYYLPVNTIAYDLGMSQSEAWGALARVCETGFAKYDDETEYVWVVNMAREQVGDDPKHQDKRVTGVKNELRKHAKSVFYDAFVDHYGPLFRIEHQKPSTPSQGVAAFASTPSQGVATPARTPSISGTGAGTGAGEGEREGEPPPETTPAFGLAPDEPEPDEPTHKLVAREFEVRFLAARGAPPSWSHKNRDHCLTIAKWLDSLAGDTPVLLGRLLEGFFREPWAVEKGFPLGALAGDPSKYLKPPTRPPGGSSPPQLVPPEKRRGLDAKEGV